MSKLTPRGEFVIVEPQKTAKEYEGLVIATNQSIKTFGTVVGVSEQVSDLQDGQVIVYLPNRNVEVDDGGRKLLFVHQEDILAVVDED